jgi:hypothetical protein
MDLLLIEYLDVIGFAFEILFIILFIYGLYSKNILLIFFGLYYLIKLEASFSFLFKNKKKF